MINVTDKAADYIKQLLYKQKNGGVCLSVKKFGCSGYAYVIDFHYLWGVEPTTVKGIDFYIDENYKDFFADVKIDLVKNGINQELQIINPNASSHCGCGHSFSL